MAIRSRDGRLDWRGVPGHLSRDTRFCIASCTKLYTGALILQLVQEGKIALDTPAAAYLPGDMMDGLHVREGTDRGDQITVHHLLCNRSGLADYFSEAPKGQKSFMAQIMAGQDVGWSDSDALVRVRQGLRAKFAPGTSGRAYYSDTNFQLLGAILENVSGESFAQLVVGRIATPLGLSQTYVHTPLSRALYSEIAPISAGTKALAVPRAMESLGAQGGVISTLDDSLAFLKAYFAGALFDRSWIETNQSWAPVFFPFRYGMGLMRLSMHPILTLFRRVPPLVGHSGSTGVLMYHCPDRDLFIAGTTNQLRAKGLPYRFLIGALQALS